MTNAENIYKAFGIQKAPMGMSWGNKKDKFGGKYDRRDVRFRERALTPVGKKASFNRRSERMYGPGGRFAVDPTDTNPSAIRPKGQKTQSKSLSEADMKQRIANQLNPPAGFDSPKVFGGALRPKKVGGAEGKSKANPTPKVENMQKAMISLQKFLDDCECDD